MQIRWREGARTIAAQLSRADDWAVNLEKLGKREKPIGVSLQRYAPLDGFHKTGRTTPPHFSDSGRSMRVDRIATALPLTRLG